MHGSRRIRRSRFQTVFHVFVISLILFGCRGTKEAERANESETSWRAFLNKYERTFNPAEYDSDVNTVKVEEQRHQTELEAAIVTTIALPETIPGYRVQVLFTQEIDQALAMRDSLEAALPEELVYVVYDAPYYKIRVGNYTNRPSANQVQRKLVSLGYRDAWVVPDNVIKNPPPRPPDTFIQPERR